MNPALRALVRETLALVLALTLALGGVAGARLSAEAAESGFSLCRPGGGDDPLQEPGDRPADHCAPCLAALAITPVPPATPVWLRPAGTRTTGLAVAPAPARPAPAFEARGPPEAS